MKRIVIRVDQELLAAARRISGEPTYSRTIERALREMVRREQARSIDTLAGSGLWVGNLAAMRGDLPRAK
jgi:Arc/MetJ family transcription regulator